MPANEDDLDGLRSEGDLNISRERDAWTQRSLDEETRRWLDLDARYFFRQSLSTPCLNVLSSCDGIHIEDGEPLDPHAPSHHHARGDDHGHGHPGRISCPREVLRISLRLAEGRNPGRRFLCREDEFRLHGRRPIPPEEGEGLDNHGSLERGVAGSAEGVAEGKRRVEDPRQPHLARDLS